MSEEAYTKVFNSVLDAMLRYYSAFTKMQVGVVLYIARQSWGFQRERCYDSQKKIADALGTSRAVICRTLHELVACCLIVDRQSNKKRLSYEICKDSKKWKIGKMRKSKGISRNPTPPLGFVDRQSNKTAKIVDRQSNTTPRAKERSLKETLKERETPPPRAPARVLSDTLFSLETQEQKKPKLTLEESETREILRLQGELLKVCSEEEIALLRRKDSKTLALILESKRVFGNGTKVVS